VSAQEIADNAFRALSQPDRVRQPVVTLPRGLAPDLEAWEGERDGRYDFAVEVRLPLVGRLVRYEGLLDLVA
jgi:hypothetical protein